MNTRLLMRASAVMLGVLGASATFLPQEILVLAGAPPIGFSVIVVQVAGALYFGFAMLNWMAKGSRIGGIYNRPIALANFAHFFMVILALLKALMSNPQLPAGLWLVAGVYAVFAVLFSLILFRHPLAEPEVSV